MAIVVDVIIEESDTIIITEQEAMGVKIEEPDTIDVTQEKHQVQLEDSEIRVELD